MVNPRSICILGVGEGGLYRQGGPSVLGEIGLFTFIYKLDTYM